MSLGRRQLMGWNIQKWIYAAHHGSCYLEICFFLILGDSRWILTLAFLELQLYWKDCWKARCLVQQIESSMSRLKEEASDTVEVQLRVLISVGKWTVEIPPTPCNPKRFVDMRSTLIPESKEHIQPSVPKR